MVERVRLVEKMQQRKTREDVSFRKGTPLFHETLRLRGRDWILPDHFPREILSVCLERLKAEEEGERERGRESIWAI